MDKSEALNLLRSQSAHERLSGANFFVENPIQGDIRELNLLLGHETVSFVKRRLEAAIRLVLKTSEAASADAASDDEIPENIRRQLWSKATETITGMLLHEFESRVGLARAAAAQEIANFEASITRARFDNLEAVLDGFRQLRKASAAPKIAEFDLAQLIRDTVAEEFAAKKVEASLQGSQPLLIASDANLLRLALSNAIRNAIEAVTALDKQAESHAVVVAWGKTDIECWITIIDRGPGIDGPVEAAFDIGRTTKAGHGGFGLAIARQAMETIGGTANLQPGASGGARLELRWSR
jgi:signal transduction histidine kinase